MKELIQESNFTFPPTIASNTLYNGKLCQDAKEEIERINKRLSMIGPSDERKRLEATKGGYELNIRLYC